MSNTVKAYRDKDGDVCYGYNGRIYPFAGECVNPLYMKPIIEDNDFYSWSEATVKEYFPRGLENHYIGEYDIDGNLVE